MAQRITVYHREDGPTEMWGVDARFALSFPDDWKDREWTDEEKAAVAAKAAPVDASADSGRKSKSS